jgi:hypothetical protein
MLNCLESILTKKRGVGRVLLLTSHTLPIFGPDPLTGLPTATVRLQR